MTANPHSQLSILNPPLIPQLDLFTSQDGAVSISTTLERETVWRSQAQMRYA